MHQRPLSQCTYPGCPRLVVVPGRCTEHRRARQDYDSRRGNSNERGYDYAWQQRRKAHLHDNPWCVMCGQTATDVDHIVPVRDGGSSEPGNLQSLCHRCHSRKTGWGKGT